MDTKQLEKFAQDARRQLHEEVAARLEYVLRTDSAELRAKEQTLQALQDEIAATSRDAVVEKVAYTWFNRFCALRYMDVNHYTRIGTVSPATSPAGETFTQPEILQEAKQGYIDPRFAEKVDAERVLGLLSGRLPADEPQQEAYRALLVGVCNAYHDDMPFMFQPIDDYTELLMPDDLLSEGSLLAAVREALTEENCADVEVIGWLYQFYISEKKDQVMGRKGKVPSEDLPAVTQLFTPHWIVRYMVENSLGRLWMLNHPDSRLAERMDYYIEPETSEVSKTSEVLRVSSPEEIRLCDPAVGSGHILTYAFDLLYAIYEEQGYNPVDIPRLILERNLTGIEIDPRAGALAGFALMMKARAADRRFFKRDGGRAATQPDICVLEDVHFTPQELDAYMDAVGRDLLTQDVEEWLQQFEQATTFGSLIRPRVTDTAFIRERLDEVGAFHNLFLSHTQEKLEKVLAMTEALGTRYHVVVANPPYMGGRSMTPALKSFAKEQYPKSKSDLCTMFVERNLDLVVRDGYVGMITMQSWMFLSSFEKLRERILERETIETMAHLGSHAFDTIGGEVVSTTAFVLGHTCRRTYKGRYIRLVDYNSEDAKAERLQNAFQSAGGERNASCYLASAKDFSVVPGVPIAYWLSSQARSAFVLGTPLEDIAPPKIGMRTGDNSRFLRYWHEVSVRSTNVDSTRVSFHGLTSGLKWCRYNKGGGYRKWYGNNEYLVNWQNDGYEIKENTLENYPQLSWDNLGWKISNEDYYFQEGLTWTFISSGSFGVRYSPAGAIFDVQGSSVFPEPQDLYWLISLMCSKVANFLMQAINPTLSFQVGNVALLPVIKPQHSQVSSIALKNVKITRRDWDAFERSWDFSFFPLLKHRKASSVSCRLSVTYIGLRTHRQLAVQEMQSLEKSNNQIFIETYGLTRDLTSKVPLSEITLTCNPHYRYGSGRLKTRNWSNFCERFPETCDRLNEISAELVPEMPEEERLGLEQRLLEDTMKEFISYAVGCMFGRYSLDRPGLILANQGETLDDYLRKVSGQLSVGGAQSSVVSRRSSAVDRQGFSFMPDADNVIPILDGDWFPDDITARFKHFLRVTFGDEHYEENLAFIELALNRDIRDYFLRDFYDDHVSTYSKRPIYWLFSSPKGSFNALVYMHRYRPDTVSIVLNDYLREFRTKLAARKEHLEGVSVSAAASKREKTRAVKEIERIDKILAELRDYEDGVLYPLAMEQLEIDLDDGVAVNYPKFGKALERVRGLS